MSEAEGVNTGQYNRTMQVSSLHRHTNLIMVVRCICESLPVIILTLVLFLLLYLPWLNHCDDCIKMFPSVFNLILPITPVYN